MDNRNVKIGNLTVGKKQDALFILGPCVIESFEALLDNAKEIKKIAAQEEINFVFKASYDKANRTSLKSFRGPGIKDGILMLKDIKEELKIYVTSDVHTPDEVSMVKDVLDVIQIPALLSRQTDLIVEAAKTGKPLNIKKGQFMAPWDMIKAVDKAYKTGNRNVLVTERGTCFGYNYLINDFRAIPKMQEDGLVVIFDATHSTQLPSKGVESSAENEYVSPLLCAAAAVGADGFFMEVHSSPQEAKSDAASMVDFETLRGLIKKIKKIRESI